MRKDALGLFWEDASAKDTKKKDLLLEEGWVEYRPGWWIESIKLSKFEEYEARQNCLLTDKAYATAKAAKTGPKAEPPEPVWLLDTYLPGLEAAREMRGVSFFTNDELITACNDQYINELRKHVLIFDVECYINYFLVAFKSPTLNKVVYVETFNGSGLDIAKLNWILENFCVVGFNSRNYDLPICALALAGHSEEALKHFTNQIIQEKLNHWLILKSQKVPALTCDHIDIIEPAPLTGSLKIYGGRMHTAKMQDLPFPHDITLSIEQAAIIRYYCINDLDNTIELKEQLAKPLALREKLSIEYDTDLRSKSDAQIAEQVIGDRVASLNNVYRCAVPKIEPYTCYQYQLPDFIYFQTPELQRMLSILTSLYFQVSEHGSVSTPLEFYTPKKLQTWLDKCEDPLEKVRLQHAIDNNINSVAIGNAVYRMGIGGLHSSETTVSYKSNSKSFLISPDVESYYPQIILNQELYPKHLGPNFLNVYGDIVKTRLHAKATEDKVTSATLKIVINGSFGKLGSKYSILYSPDLLIQVTLTGQLCLLMLIEMLELSGITVVSANTDGIVLDCLYTKKNLMHSIVQAWEAQTKFVMEFEKYKSIHCRDVNNYIAIKEDGDIKTKGIFAKTGLSKNPTNTICIDAIKEYLVNEIPIEETVKNCTDFTKFISVRNVKGGGAKIYEPGEEALYLGKAVRWYYATEQVGCIVYAGSGKMVARTVGACPVMEMPDKLPTNIDYDWYINESYSILKDVGL